MFKNINPAESECEDTVELLLEKQRNHWKPVWSGCRDLCLGEPQLLLGPLQIKCNFEILKGDNAW